MALQTDLSRNPYFDDFNVNKNFYRVLYRPGVALQTRELNQMQSIMQDQIEKFGRFVFKDGSVTEGCSFTFDDKYTYVKINDNYSNNFAYTITDFNDKVVTNDNGLQAVIVNTVSGYESQDPDLNTLYIKYLNSVSYPNGSTQSTFANGENLAIATNIGVPVGNVTAATVVNNAGVGYAFTTSAGTIFKKGFFISVEPQTIIISKYDNLPDNISVGFSAVENIITPEGDSSLYDNAAGSPNYVAPGAHRLQLIPTLVTRTTTELGNNATFFSLCDFKSGKPVSIKNTPQLASLGSEMAKRTYETNGNYVVYPFVISTDTKAPNDPKVATHNNLVSSRGLGYVEGYRVEFVNNNKIDLRKGTDYQTLQRQTVSANFGYYVYINDFCGAFDTSTGIIQVELHSVAKNALSAGGFLSGWNSANKIGTAWVRGIAYDSGIVGTQECQYRLYLFNVQMLPGFNFTQVKSVIAGAATTSAGIADVVQTYNAQTSTYGAAIQQGKYSNMLYPIGQKAAKLDGFDNTSYVYRAKSSSTFANNGSTKGEITLTLPALHGTGAETMYRTGTFTGSSTFPFLVVATSDGYTPNKTGNVSVATGSSNIAYSGTGTTTAFLTDYMVGDWIYLNSIKREISFIANNTFMQVKVPFPAGTITNLSHKKYFPVGIPIDFSKTNGTINRSITGTTSNIVCNLGEGLDGGGFNGTAYFDVLRSATVPISKNIKKNTFVAINCASHSFGSTGPYSLGFSDVNKINAIYIGTSSAFVNSGVNYATSFGFDNGQRDSHYDLSSISVLNPGLLNANSRILVDLDVFTYTDSAGVGFFNGNSYPVDTNAANVNSISISEIPQYTAQDGSTFDLRDSIDFRPFANNTANSTANSTNWSTVATRNPSSTLAFAAPYSQTYLPTPDTVMQMDHQHYLGRIDRVVLRTDGALAIIEGTANTTPVPPADQAGAMTLGLATIPPYPSLTTTDAKIYKRYDYSISTSITQNKRYTMKDINVLSNKIDNLEYYTSLSLLESSAKNTLVRSSATGQNRFQNGILVDSFAGHDIGNTIDPNYHIAIDSKKTELRPSFQYFNRPLQFDPNKSTGVVQKGKMVLLEHTSVPYIKQGFANKYRNCIDGNIYTFRGDITFDPPGSTMPEVNKSPDVVTNIDLASNWVNLGASAFGSQWGGWNTTSKDKVTLGAASTTSVTDAYGNIINTTNQQQTTTTTTDSQRQGQQLNVTTSKNEYNLGTFVTDVSILPYVKSIEVRVTCHGLKPNTRVWVFMNNINVTGHFQQKDSTFTNLLKGFDQTPNPHYTPAVVPVGFTKPGLFTDATGSIYGVFTIPPNTFRATTLEMNIVDVDDIQAGEDAITTRGDGTFYGSTLSISKGSSILSTVEASVSVKEVKEEKTTVTETVKNNQTVVIIPAPTPAADPDPWSGGSCCFDPDSKVLMADGSWKRIADIEVGDSVSSHKGINKVVGTMTTTVQKRKMIKFDGYNFYCTHDHLFLTQNGWKTWKPESLIERKTLNSIFLINENRTNPIDENDKMVLSSGEYIEYSDLKVEELDFDADYVVYDLHLDGDSTYVIEGGFVVHNCGGCGGNGGGGCGSGGY